MATEAAPTHGSRQSTKDLSFSPNALTVLESRYLARNEKGETTEKPHELLHRVAATVASAELSFGLSAGAVETIRDEFLRIMASGQFMPNSPTLMNAGRAHGMLSACFVLPVEDSVDGIFSAIRQAALVQKSGGGTGFSFSRLRPKGDRVASSGGTTSGPLSFMKVFAQATGAIQQGAFRRGANMGIMRIDHPDILDFVNIKCNHGELTNFNLSVGLTDEFIHAFNSDPSKAHVVRNPRSGETHTLQHEEGSSWTVGEMFELIVERAWESGEPGMVLLDRMNEDNPTPHVGQIEATNPCGEQPLLPYESCNLGSINLSKFVIDGPDGPEMDFNALREVICLATRFLDDVVDVNRYPIPEIAEISRGNRKIGLGVMGFADMLYALGIPYDSDEGLVWGERVMRFLNEESHKVSAELAEERGVFPNWEGSTWAQKGIRMRNACTTTVAPTGTISIIAGCSGGIEPLFSLAFHRNVLDGKRLTEVNARFEKAAMAGGFFSRELVAQAIRDGSIQNAKTVPKNVRRVFVTAHDIAPQWHIRMQAAFQKHCDASISKTINFPEDATIDDVRKIYQMAITHGCKGVTVYRDGCRKNQPMALEKTATDEEPSTRRDHAKPMQLGEVMTAVRVKQVTPFGNMHVKVVVDPISGRELEVFAQLGKGGDLACSDLEAMCRLVSLYLRIGGSLADIVGQLEGIGSSLSMPTKDGRISSLADGLAKAVQKYQCARNLAGLESLLLGRSDLSEIEKGMKASGLDSTPHLPAGDF